MDAVRFGRALGLGARQAAKTVARAVDAARAENPSKSKDDALSHPASAANAISSAAPVARRAAPHAVWNPPPVARPIARATAAQDPMQRAAQTAALRATRPRGVREGLNRFRDSAIEPAVRLSGVLWLEAMGVFFGLFALAAASGLWRLRGEMRTALAHPFAHGGVIAAAAIFALFAYFCVSSFVRAHRRQRRR